MSSQSQEAIAGSNVSLSLGDSAGEMDFSQLFPEADSQERKLQ